ncbi:TIGR01777 family oxidoreductase [Corallibacter sp.]|uniref:TIGR01777 family oxidoreductase n=1 Tax=Corallibacter sp. TaxID=2038084 RepID=UPI003AB37796
MTVLITGATGLVGKAIVKQCHENSIKVHYLTTSKNKIQNKENYKGFYWNPEKEEIDSNCFKDVDTIINLAGATISKRWTKQYKKQIINSRINTLKLLKTALLKEQLQISHIISASAIGVYPSSLTNYYHEDSEQISPSFLGSVVKKWETATDDFSQLGMRVSKVRIGLVLDSKEGALPQIVKPITFGFGAAFGSGNQWQSWIHINDLARLFVYVMEERLEGTFNAVAPNPVTNTDLTKTVAKILNKPLWLPNIPKSIMKLILGEMHILLFESQRVSSKKIETHAFNFKYPNLLPALENLLLK